MVIGDLNGDGKADILATEPADQTTCPGGVTYMVGLTGGSSGGRGIRPWLRGGADPAVRAASERAMKDVYVRAKKKAGYAAGFFLTMLSEYGGLGTARRLLASPEASSGFTALYERGRFDLTVEAVVVRSEFAELFTEQEVEVARRRLVRLGYL
jgi:hypothetical protein